MWCPFWQVAFNRTAEQSARKEVEFVFQMHFRPQRESATAEIFRLQFGPVLSEITFQTDFSGQEQLISGHVQKRWGFKGVGRLKPFSSKNTTFTCCEPQPQSLKPLASQIHKERNNTEQRVQQIYSNPPKLQTDESTNYGTRSSA